MITREQVKETLGATLMKESEVTSNYAVPLDDGSGYCQVDVHVCPDAEDWERVMFFHSYGDLGTIIGSIVRHSGMSAGTKGLRIVGMPPPLPAFYLSTSPDAICAFLGLSMNAWKSGFDDRCSIFKWASCSQFFDPADFQRVPKNNAKERQRNDRTMYQEFMEWTRAQPPNPRISSEYAVRKALEYFGKDVEYDTLIMDLERRKRVKELWNGNKVQEWIGISEPGLWRTVKEVMTRVREKLGGDEGVGQLEEDEMRRWVAQCFSELMLERAEKPETISSDNL